MSRGFAPIAILVAVILGIVAVGGGAYFVVHQQSLAGTAPEGAPAVDAGEASSDTAAQPSANTQATTKSQAESGASTNPTSNSASISISNVFTQSVAVQYKNIPGKASQQIVNKSGERFDTSSYAQTLVSNGAGSLTIALGECTPAGDYYVRAVEQVEQKVSGNEIPYSVAGATLAQSAVFHYGGAPRLSVCDAISNQQAQGNNSAIVIGPGSLLTTEKDPVYIVGTATVDSVTVKITNSEGAVVLQSPSLAVSNNHWRYSPSQSLPVGTYTVSVSGGSTTATGVLKVTAGVPTCTLTLDKSLYQYGESITLSWTSQNATYVAFDQGGSSPAMNLPSGKLTTNGSITVQPGAGADIALLRAYSDTGEGHCIAYPQMQY